jgi:hypothetical protein
VPSPSFGDPTTRRHDDTTTRRLERDERNVTSGT